MPPSLRELLNIAVTGAARRCEHSFNAHGGILSGPVALFTLLLSSANLVSLTVIVNLAGSGSLKSKMGCVALCFGKSSLIDTKHAFIRLTRVSISPPINAFANPSISFNIVTGNSTLTVGLVYRSPNISIEENEKMHNAIKEVSKRDCIIMGDFNHGHIKWTSLQSPGIEDQEFLNLVQDSFLFQHVLEPIRDKNVLDIVLSSQKEFVDNVNICEPLGCSDHNQIHFIIKVKGERNRKIRYRKNFHKGRYKDMREYLAKIDWNNTLKNKTATECWNILKREIDCVVDKFVPLKKQGKRSKKKHLSKEAIRKIKYKQMMWKTYRHTGSDEDYAIYKEALNQATAEIRN